MRDHYYDRKKKIQSSVWRVRDRYYDRKKKVLVVCLAGAQSLFTTGKKISSIVFGVTYILSVQCTVVLLCQFFGEKRGGRQRGECDGAHPPIDKNWWGDLTTMMTKI